MKKKGKLACDRLTHNRKRGLKQTMSSAPKKVAGKGKDNWPHQKGTAHSKSPDKIF